MISKKTLNYRRVRANLLSWEGATVTFMLPTLSCFLFRYSGWRAHLWRFWPAIDIYSYLLCCRWIVSFSFSSFRRLDRFQKTWRTFLTRILLSRIDVGRPWSPVSLSAAPYIFACHSQSSPRLIFILPTGKTSLYSIATPCKLDALLWIFNCMPRPVSLFTPRHNGLVLPARWGFRLLVFVSFFCLRTANFYCTFTSSLPSRTKL